MFFWYTAAAAKSLQSCPTLCDFRDGSPPGSPIPGILHAGTLEWVQTHKIRCGHIHSSFPLFIVKLLWRESFPSQRVHVLSHFSHVQFCNPMDHSLVSSSVCRTLQARILEWVTMPSFRGSSWPRDRTHISMFPALARGFFTTDSPGNSLNPAYSFVNNPFNKWPSTGCLLFTPIMTDPHAYFQRTTSRKDIVTLRPRM